MFVFKNHVTSTYLFICILTWKTFCYEIHIFYRTCMWRRDNAFKFELQTEYITVCSFNFFSVYLCLLNMFSIWYTFAGKISNRFEVHPSGYVAKKIEKFWKFFFRKCLNIYTFDDDEVENVKRTKYDRKINEKKKNEIRKWWRWKMISHIIYDLNWILRFIVSTPINSFQQKYT